MLKLTEEWLGEQLFILERNNLIPTQAADCTYQRLYHHYCALDLFRKERNTGFRISSPIAGKSVMTNLLSACFDCLTEHTTVRYAGSMHPDDDIFVGLQPSVLLPCFEIFQTDMVLELHCLASVGERWCEIPVLSEQGIDQQSCFQRVVEEMRRCGHSGHMVRIDNSVWLNKVFKRGEGLCFRRPGKRTENHQILPFIIHLPLYIYINKTRSDSRHENFLEKIRSEMH